MSEIKRWCERDYIRMDRSRDCETNIDPILVKLSSRDRENYARAIQSMEEKKGVDDPVGWGPRRVPAAYERGFDMGLAVNAVSLGTVETSSLSCYQTQQTHDLRLWAEESRTCSLLWLIFRVT